VHVSIADDGQPQIDAVVHGDTVREVLQYVQFDAKALLDRVRSAAEHAVRTGRITDHQAGRLLSFYKHGLEGYTYLEEAHES
jgi:arginine decarboxylase